jgi:hypothetical protein
MVALLNSNLEPLRELGATKTVAIISFPKNTAELSAPLFLCAGHVRQLGGESPLPILTEEKG